MVVRCQVRGELIDHGDVNFSYAREQSAGTYTVLLLVTHLGT